MQKHILVVDDSESIRELVRMTLTNEGFTVETADDGQQACLYLDKDVHVDLIITDLHMPNMDGIELIKKIRESGKHSRVPILFLTTESQQDKKMEAKNSGATGWIIKPFVPDKLISALKKVLR